MSADQASDRVAQWLDGTLPADTMPPPGIWACVEIFGHRKHYGRVREVELFGTKREHEMSEANPETTDFVSIQAAEAERDRRWRAAIMDFPTNYPQLLPNWNWYVNDYTGWPDIDADDH